MLKNYLMIALKVYSRRKLFTAINLLCIVLTLVVLLVVTSLLQMTFVPTGVEGKSERFLQVPVMTQIAKSYNARTHMGYRVIDNYLRKMKSVEMVAGYSAPEPVSIYQDQRVIQLQWRHTDAEYWKILDFNVVAGRVLNQEDVAQGRFVVILNESTAKRLFLDASPLGKTINAGGQQFEVIGVVEDALHLNAYAELWVPHTTYANSTYKEQLRGNFNAMLMAKSKEDFPKIRDELLQIAQQVNTDSPNQMEHTYLWADSKLDVFARTLLGREEAADSGAYQLLAAIAFAMVLFMVLPALNLINLNVSRIMERASEIGVRKAFGASKMQLITQFLIENILLCLVGGLIGIVLTQFILVGLGASGIIPYLKVDVNVAVLMYGFVISTIFGILSGVIPAWKMSRLDPVHALKGMN
jgi:putative ABC transport system permease protein